jgi:hypothetical protein
MGDEAVMVLMDRVHAMPMRIMFITLISEGLSVGSEGATFALLTSIQSLGAVFGIAIGGMLTKVWDVSNTALEVSYDISSRIKNLHNTKLNYLGFFK